MNAATLVDPALAQIATDDRHRSVKPHTFTGTTTFPLNDFNWMLRLEWRATETPLGVGSMRGFLGVEHDVEILSLAVVSADGRIVPVPLDFVARDLLDDYQYEIEGHLDAKHFDGDGL